MVFTKKNSYRWTSLLIGILAILIGFFVFLHQNIGLSILSIIFIAFFLLSGVLEIATASKSNSLGVIVNGVINLIFGVLLLILPTPDSIHVLMYYFGFYLLFQSIIGVYKGFKLNKNININGYPFIICSSLGIVLSVIILCNPTIFSSILVFIFSLAFICCGIYKIYDYINSK